MGYYFEDHQSMLAQAGLQVKKTLDIIMRRYRGQNPPHLPSYRPYQRGGILRGKDYRYHADFTKEYPEAPDGAFVYAWGRIWSEGASEIRFDVSCRCPTVVYHNGESLFRSTFLHERYPDERHALQIRLQPGWNHVVMRFRKTRAGFGGVFGTWLGKLPYYFLMPTPERAGQEGWIYTEPLLQELAVVPGPGTSEDETGVVWGPTRSWSAAKLRLGQCQRIFGNVPGACAVGWTRAALLKPGRGDYRLHVECRSPVVVTIGDHVILSTRKAGAFDAEIQADFGVQDLMVRTECRGDDWGFELSLHDGEQAVEFSSPCQLQGLPEPWIYLGPLAADQEIDQATLRNLHRITPGLTGDVYWRIDAPDTWVRPYNDNALYGRWNYPLGVTLYGLLHSARTLNSEETQQYIVDHIQFCCDIFDYAMWDRQQYGGATNVHHLLTSIDSLDDCGSFGSCVLEVAKYCELRGAREISDYVADFITNRQVRLPDGTFFRKHLMHEFHEDTLWADDLYMSVPFLCRYYELTGESCYIDDAARQFLGFRKHLYMPELKLMSHVYDFGRNMATGVPWGRGNGWVAFSLSELLAVLPADHAMRGDLLAMFRELCAGYLAQQDEAGMWHQVLNEHDSYPETSCTSMFAYAFARGVRYGWLEEPQLYVRSVFKAWEALNRTSIDRLGNIYGVCRGSEFSFTSEYYKKDLTWNLNDTHGIGIVLLAGIEVLRLTEHLQHPEDPGAEGTAGKSRAENRRGTRRATAAAAGR